ncbi:unnamed protein product [Protopolystoma xenopodis]|uniref:ferroxidase n=1 Tax=Protopolystoma xenopodis TaxID=117903 RepID=A0A3S5C6W8_9PLAT|nr:unnamed protein product [Protopolystoma xenopodis]
MSCRTSCSPEVEQAINNGINMHFSGEITYNYLASICIYDNISMPCFGEFLRLCGMRMRHTAEQMVKYQLIRGGQWQMSEGLKPLVALPVINQNDDINSMIWRLMELGLETERSTEKYLRELCQVASSKQDVETCGFVQSSLIKQQRFVLKVMVMHQTGLTASQNAWLYCNMVITPFVREVKELIENNKISSKFSHYNTSSSTSSSSHESGKVMNSGNSLVRLFSMSFLS